MNINKLKNNKFYFGKLKNLEEHQGWIVGSFYDKDDPRKCDFMEIVYREHKAGDTSPPHYHKKKVELLIMLKGKAEYQINDKKIKLASGDYFFADVNNVISGKFLESSKIIAIHSPSIPGDKKLWDGKF